MRFVGVALVLVLAGCRSMEDGARDDFSRDHTCPVDRVEARVRKDIRPSSLAKAETPPAEIAADPGRLKMWQDERAKNAQYADSNRTIVEVRGCGKLELQECSRGSRDTNKIFCSKVEYPAGVAKWQ